MAMPLVMIIEDDPKLSLIYALSLQKNCESEIITDGDQALLRLNDVQPAIVILDLHLPGASGTQILRKIRADARLSNTHVIVATADPAEADTIRDQADLVLIKPISPTQLQALISRFLLMSS